MFVVQVPQVLLLWSVVHQFTVLWHLSACDYITTITYHPPPLLQDHFIFTITSIYHQFYTITKPPLQDHLFTSNTVTTLSFHEPYISSTPSFIHQCTTTTPLHLFFIMKPSPSLYHCTSTTNNTPSLWYNTSTTTNTLSLHHYMSSILSLHHHYMKNTCLLFLCDSYVATCNGCYQAFLNELRLSSFFIATGASCVVCDGHWLWRQSHQNGFLW
jgi:hypothetical protein